MAGGPYLGQMGSLGRWVGTPVVYATAIVCSHSAALKFLAALQIRLHELKISQPKSLAPFVRGELSLALTILVLTNVEARFGVIKHEKHALRLLRQPTAQPDGRGCTSLGPHSKRHFNHTDK